MKACVLLFTLLALTSARQFPVVEEAPVVTFSETAANPLMEDGSPVAEEEEEYEAEDPLFFMAPEEDSFFNYTQLNNQSEPCLHFSAESLTLLVGVDRVKICPNGTSDQDCDFTGRFIPTFECADPENHTEASMLLVWNQDGTEGAALKSIKLKFNNDGDLQSIKFKQVSIRDLGNVTIYANQTEDAAWDEYFTTGTGFVSCDIPIVTGTVEEDQQGVNISFSSLDLRGAAGAASAATCPAEAAKTTSTTTAAPSGSEDSDKNKKVVIGVVIVIVICVAVVGAILGRRYLKNKRIRQYQEITNPSDLE